MADEVRMAVTGLLRKAEAEPGLDGRRAGVRVLAEALLALKSVVRPTSNVLFR